MVRMQIYLTKIEQQGLQALAQRSGRSQSELIREAVDKFLVESQEVDRLALLKQGRRLWQDREDLPDFNMLRRELDRYGNDTT